MSATDKIVPCIAKIYCATCYESGRGKTSREQQNRECCAQCWQSIGSDTFCDNSMKLQANLKLTISLHDLLFGFLDSSHRNYSVVWTKRTYHIFLCIRERNQIFGQFAQTEYPLPMAALHTPRYRCMCAPRAKIMCYSAAASFVVGGVLLPVGLYCVRESLKKNSDYLGFATIPLIFSFQQFAEGFVWIGLTTGEINLTKNASLIFLLFAFTIWPFWILFSSWLVEDRPRRKQTFKTLSLLGLLFGVLIYAPILLNPDQWLATSVAGHSIRYDFLTITPFDAVPRSIWQWIYVIFIVTPLFKLENVRLRIFGALITGAAITANAIYWSEYISVWCLFAAILSVYMTWVLKKLPHDVTASS